MNQVIIEPVKREVELKVIHIESEYSFANPYMVVDNPKERGT